MFGEKSCFGIESSDFYCGPSSLSKKVNFENFSFDAEGNTVLLFLDVLVGSSEKPVILFVKNAAFSVGVILRARKECESL